MPRYLHRFMHYFSFVFMLIACIIHHVPIQALSSLTKHDAYPVFSPNDPQEYLLTKEKLKAAFEDWGNDRGDRFSFSVSAFFQNADRGKSFEGGSELVDSTNEGLGYKESPLLDLTGRTPMIPLVFGAVPQGAQLGPILQAAQTGLFPTKASPFEDENELDPNQLFGFFSFPAKYHQRGLRFDMQVQLFGDFGLHAQGGFSSICQSAKPPKNLTCNAPTDCPFTPKLKEADVNNLLMDQLECIAKEINLDICDFQETSADELRLQLYWRHAYEVNTQRDDWPQLLVIPFAEFGGSFSPGSARNTNQFYGLAFGNNKHHAVGFTGGLNIDFVETIEIGGSFGYTHFFDRDFDCFRVPNSKLQRNMFPFRTTVNVKPGHNLHYSGKIASRHFLERLSMFFEYVSIEHHEDCITLKKHDPAFKPEELAKETGFKTKIANIGFTYDFSPNFTLGFLWQAPLSQRNTYRNTTVMFGVTGYF